MKFPIRTAMVGTTTAFERISRCARTRHLGRACGVLARSRGFHTWAVCIMRSFGSNKRKAQEVMRRREVVTFLGGAAVAWPFAASAQQPALLVIGFLHSATASGYTPMTGAFRKSLSED